MSNSRPGKHQSILIVIHCRSTEQISARAASHWPIRIETLGTWAFTVGSALNRFATNDRVPPTSVSEVATTFGSSEDLLAEWASSPPWRSTTTDDPNPCLALPVVPCSRRSQTGHSDPYCSLRIPSGPLQWAASSRAKASSHPSTKPPSWCIRPVARPFTPYSLSSCHFQGLATVSFHVTEVAAVK